MFSKMAHQNSLISSIFYVFAHAMPCHAINLVKMAHYIWVQGEPYLCQPSRRPTLSLYLSQTHTFVQPTVVHIMFGQNVMYILPKVKLTYLNETKYIIQIVPDVLLHNGNDYS